MRKLYLVLFLLQVVSIFAEEKIMRIEYLLNDGLYKNYNEISQLSVELSENEKYMILNDHQKNAGWPFVANFVFGCGIGSFIQGDNFGGFLALSGDLVGSSIIFLNYLVPYGIWFGKRSEADFYISPFYTDKNVILLATGLLLTTRIFELIRPWVFSSSYNNKLRNALTEKVKISFGILPNEQDLRKVNVSAVMRIPLE